MDRIWTRLLLCFAIGGAPLRGFGAEPPRSCAGPQFRGGGAHEAVYCGDPVRRVAGALWRFRSGGAIESSPAAAGDFVYFGSEDGFLHAVALSTGREIWRFDAGGAVDGSPAVDAGSVYATSRNRRVFALDRATGRQKWSVSFGDDLPFAWGYDVFLSSPVVDGPSLYVGAGDGGVYRLSAADGEVIWKFLTGGRVRSSPALAGGVVYAGSFDGVFYAIDARSGKLRWKYATEGAAIDCAKWGFDRRSINSSAAVADGVVTFGSRDAHQYALDAATGRFLWKIAHPVALSADHAELAWCEGSPAIADGVSYVGSSDGHFVDAVELRTGRELWRRSTPGRVIGSPAISGDLLVCGGEDATVFALDRKEGNPVWSFRTGGRVYSSPAVARSTVLVGCADGSMYALSDARPGAGFVPRRAVYWDEKLSGWFSGAAAIRDYLASEGYELLDAAALPRFLENRIEDGVPSVVVFASDEPPSSLTETAGDTPPLVRRYLEAGGRAVWVGFPPFALKFDESTGKRTGLDAARGLRILGVGRSAFSSEDAEDRGATPTAEGLSRGLPRSWMGSFPVSPADVGTVLARDRDGLANAWAKPFGRGEFVRVWGLRSPMTDLEALRRIAEHGFEREGAR
ncbi:MAG TPA: PQQ-binding-like beta-propeller repeat protein [Thermoanaerobaculia bacterium]|nr:PQQ-binding-like beta-propeller repeat protein [Thermoanaerobaculia bacterium]